MVRAALLLPGDDQAVGVLRRVAPGGPARPRPLPLRLPVRQDARVVRACPPTSAGGSCRSTSRSARSTRTSTSTPRTRSASTTRSSSSPSRRTSPRASSTSCSACARPRPPAYTKRDTPTFTCVATSVERALSALDGTPLSDAVAAMTRAPALALLAALLLAARRLRRWRRRRARTTPPDPVAQVPSGLQEQGPRRARPAGRRSSPRPGGKTLQALADAHRRRPGDGPGRLDLPRGPGEPRRVRRDRPAGGLPLRQDGALLRQDARRRRPRARSSRRPTCSSPTRPTAPSRPRRRPTRSPPSTPPQVPFKQPGEYSVMAVTLVDGKPVAAPGRLTVIDPGRRQDPRGRRRRRPRRRPTRSRPPAATPRRSTRAARRATCTGTSPTRWASSRWRCSSRRRSCASRACAGRSSTSRCSCARGTATRWTSSTRRSTPTTIPSKGLRKPLQEFNLPTEPWLFVVGKDGRITARLEGSFGLDAFEQALKTAL